MLTENQKRFVIEANSYEFRLIMQGLFRMRAKCADDLRRSREQGFVPDKGKINVAEARSATLENLMFRLNAIGKETENG